MSDPQAPGNAVDDKSVLTNKDIERKARNDTPGGQPVEDVEDRPNVGTVRPEDYPPDQRAKGTK